MRPSRNQGMFALAALAALLLAPAARAQLPPGAVEDTARPAWPKEVVELMSSVPVQEEGRVKPLSTVAAFTLLRVAGNRTYRTEGGERFTPTEWLLDCLFHPDYASRQRVFLIENDEALDAVGLSHEGKKRRDRYTYGELESARVKVFQKAQEYAHVDAGDRTPVQEQIVRLGMAMRDFEALTHYLDFARHSYQTTGSKTLQSLFPGRDDVRQSEVLSRAPELLTAARGLQQNPEELTKLRELLIEIEQHARASMMIAFMAPTGGDEHAEWLTPYRVAEQAFGAPGELEGQIAALARLEDVVTARQSGASDAQLEKSVRAFHESVVALAEARGEYSKVELEVLYYKGQFFFYALLLFIFGFVLASTSWLMPWSRKLAKVAPWPIVLGLVLVTVGITLRCIIRGRPPVSTLYETIIFITGIMVLSALVTEWINRQRVALGLAALLGALGMFLANKFEISGRTDTMPSLVAVLDTNFWLSTHVTTVTIGYAAGLLASAVAHVYLVGRLLGFKRREKPFYKAVSRMVYGLIAFSLVFSVVGTILGGVWANDSWGRFWGWDPKENGALLICLWELIILHGRMGGYLRDFGLSMMAVFGGMVVAASWWGVNLLQIGLHSYGFTSGAFVGLMIFYGIEGVVLLAAGIYWLITRDHKARSGPTAPDLADLTA